MNKEKLLEIGIQKRNGLLDLTWQEIADQYGEDIFNNGEILRSWIKNQVLRSGDSKPTTQNSNNKVVEKQSEDTYKETFEINKDGSQLSSKLIKLSLEQKKNPRYLLEAHGFDPDEWELINAKASEWSGYSKRDGQFPMYASKITAKSKASGFSFDQLVEVIRNVPPIFIETEYRETTDKRLLELPFFDSHFGISDIDYYKQTLDDSLTLISSRHWEEILLIIGQDMLHNDDFKGRTANGTPIQQVDMKKAWTDALEFYSKLISNAIKKSNKVKVIYSKGNHDESMSWAFVQFLGERFPQIEVDDIFEERKIHTFGKVFIGITHGDKAKRNLHNLFQVEFPMEWAMATTREIHSGHLHTEDAKDWFGMMVRTLSTRNKTDSWHRDFGFVGAHKRFMLFEYSLEELKSIHYV